MTSQEIRRTLSQVGYAKVIAVLKPDTGLSLDAARKDLSANFITPDEEQMEGLVLSAKTFSSRPTRRTVDTPPTMKVYPRLGLALGFVDEGGAAALTNDSRISKVVQAPELSLIRPVAMSMSQETVDTTWGIKRLNVDKLWTQKQLTGKGVIVGHLDTGVDGTHPDLADAINSFAEFDHAGEQVPDAKATDSAWHGTHTAATIVARSGARGSLGVAPGAQLASAMVIEGGAVIDRILAGLEWLAGEGCRIVSLSLGLRGYTPAFEVVITALRNLGILPVIAIGNDNANSSRSPGNYVNVLSVGAFDSADQVAGFSSSQRIRRAEVPLVPKIVGPGVDTLSCLPNNDYGLSSGTSMATPHIAGLAALLLEAKPSATVDELEDAIVRSARRTEAMAAGRASHGVPDGLVALDILLGDTTQIAQATMKKRIKAAKPPARSKHPSK